MSLHHPKEDASPCSSPCCDLLALLVPDSITAEESLLDCSLLSNPGTDLLDEFAPLAVSSQTHKGKFLFRVSFERRDETKKTKQRSE